MYELVRGDLRPDQSSARSSIQELVIPRKNPCSLAFAMERALFTVGQDS